MREMKFLLDFKNVSIVFFDDGVCKRFYNFFFDEDFIICVKIRDGNRRIVKVKDGNFVGRYVFIIDDFVQFGGTLKECVKVLYEKGVIKVSVYVIYVVFLKEFWRKFVDSDVKFENFWIIDFLLYVKMICEYLFFKFLFLSEFIVDLFLGYDLML